MDRNRKAVYLGYFLHSNLMLKASILHFIDINECASSPCVRGSCSNQVNKYYCSCPGGWTGTRCDVGKFAYA